MLPRKSHLKSTTSPMRGPLGSIGKVETRMTSTAMALGMHKIASMAVATMSSMRSLRINAKTKRLRWASAQNVRQMMMGWG